ncbi:unnamed protein product [Cuscuta epithymum]|uniref:RING-type E3 ubiquitin transferase n=1 Tax=Cuscuta epithymum TaxID=186058 RepID=A0AAV0DU72_9ASTE|nr:unnamed protein product [Cuscuta epithymum]
MRMASSEINLVMTAIGFALSSMFIVYVCARLICARILQYYNPSDHIIIRRGCNGLDPLVISSFPVKKYSDAFFASIQDAQCTICLADYQREDSLRILSPCAHYFHPECIDIWLQNNSTCPVCRISLQSLPQKKHFMEPLFSSAAGSQRHFCSIFASSRTHRSPIMDPPVTDHGGLSSV